jgi:D-alanyl-D-alanine carboxypeptidase
MRKLMLTTVFLIVAAILFAGPLFAGTDLTPPETDQIRVRNAVDSVRRDLEKKLGNPVPSLNVLIQTPREEIFVSSVHENVTPVTKDTYFRFASNTKIFTSTAILKMYQDGWLDYRAKITDPIPGSRTPYVPDSPEWSFPNKDKITIEQLLQHSAGVYDVDNDKVPGLRDKTYTEYELELNPRHQFNVDEFAGLLTSKRLSYFPPGTSHHYSNTGYTILSRIISRVYSVHAKTSKTYADYLDDHIVGKEAKVPFETIHFPILASNSELPTPFVPGIIQNNKESSVISSCNLSAQVGEGNGYGTMNDLNKYIRSLMKGQNVLSAKTVSLMQTDKSPGHKTYCLGCFFINNLGYGHNGARVGNLSLMVYDPIYDISVIVYMPLFDLSNGMTSMMECINTMPAAGWAAREALGYPGKPAGM